MGERLSQLPVGVDVTASPSAEGHDESPEKLSLKARLKLFEKEIEQQGSAAPAPKPGKLCFPSNQYVEKVRYTPDQSDIYGHSDWVK